ncbi:hypothetical protein AB0K34_20055 [Actinomadura sp. NPDC049382]|uniref:hypothetical protein n=1 Tax=Actinomadura sp. NPDC049382 TaxID=3158220 RepID=UPI00343D9DE4
MTDHQKNLPARFYTDDTQSIAFMLQKFGEVLSHLREGETLQDYTSRKDEVIVSTVQSILELTRDFDAFDIIDLMRQRETPLYLPHYRESSTDKRAAAIELVAVLMSARGYREPDTKSTSYPNEIIEKLHAYCSQLLDLSVFARLHEAERHPEEPLADLAATYAGHELNVRVKQYVDIQEEINSELFSSRRGDAQVLETIGFTYEEFTRVRDSVSELYEEKFHDALAKLGQSVQNWVPGEPPSDVDLRRGSEATFSIFATPGKRASFTTEDVVAHTGLELSKVNIILNTFSTHFEAKDATESVASFLDGDGPYNRAALLVDNEGNYITIGLPLGTDCFRQVVEARLKGTKAWNRYDSRRMRASEQLSVKYLSRLLGVPVAHVALKYLRPREGVPITALNHEATNLQSISDQTEADALFLIEDVAICVEVKARSVSEQARRGQIRRLSTDLKRTIGEAHEQACRLETLIAENQGLWLENREWLDLEQVREIRSIAVCLDDMGPLGTGLDELVRAGIIKRETFPWIVSLHDLAVISRVLDRPAEFLLYLRRRTNSHISLLFRAVDELDLFMLFMGGKLYAEPDPQLVYERFSQSGKPTPQAEKQFRKQSTLTRVSTLTDRLDHWMYGKQGVFHEAPSKPTFVPLEGIAEIVDYLANGHKSGWLRFSADLLNLSTESQRRTLRNLKKITDATKRDQSSHSTVQCYPDDEGFPTLFAATLPPGGEIGHALRSLEMYITAKKHQLGSDRSLGILLSEGNIIASRYMNTRVTEDAQLDRLVAAMGLQSPEVMRRPVPPPKKSKRKPTKKSKRKPSSKNRRKRR